MVSIGEYELKVLKAIAIKGGSVSATRPDLTVEGGEVSDALRKLLSAEYLAASGQDLVLTEQAEEYLELLGLL
jgi:hypothetical protein